MASIPANSPSIYTSAILPPPFLATPTALAMEPFLLYSISIRPETAEGYRFRLPWVLLMEFSDYISSSIEFAIIRVILV